MTIEQERKAIARYERKLAREKERRATDPAFREKHLESCRQWQATHKEYVREYNRKRRQRQREEKAALANVMVSKAD